MGATKYPGIPVLTGGTPSLPNPGQPAPMGPAEFQSGSVANVTTFGFDEISPPASVYVQRDDQLILETASQQGIVETVRFNYRFLRVPEPQGGQPSEGGVGKHPGQIFTRGIIEVGTFDLPALANRTLARRIVQMQEGYLLSVTAGATAAVQRGQTWVRAYLLRGVTNISPLAQNCAQLLLSDYTYINQPIGWPGGRQAQSTESTGFLHSLQQANPGGGNDWIFTVPAQNRWRVISIQAQLAVANSGAARPVEVIVDDGTNVYARMAANITFPINATTQLNFSNSGTPSTAIVSDAYAQMPSALTLPAGHRIRSNTTNIVAGDTWTNIWMLLEEYIDAI